MQLPTIHLNGTSKESLLEQWADAHAAVRKAIEQLANAAPHGRDYYPQGPDAYTVARDEHVLRLAKLVEVKKDLELLSEGVYFK